MICKNCSAPYHGYRTCPQPANLNTMLQLFMEFCMQQLQNFSKDVVSNDGIPKPLIDAGTNSNTTNQHKTNKLKRKQQKTTETHGKTKQSKKRKLSNSKKKSSKNDSDDSSDSSDDDKDNNTESSSSESEEDSSDSPAESLHSSKKKLKLKNLKSKTTALNLSNFTPNPVNLPLVLNGFPNLAAVGAANVQNPNTSSNALNTLLLTQMFQNAIGSLKQ